MKTEMDNIYNELFERYPILSGNKEAILNAFHLLEQCYTLGGKTLLCGNGGSASDSEHIVGELMKGFIKKRPLSADQRKQFDSLGDDYSNLAEGLQGTLPAISLVSQSALLTAYANDISPAMIFAQQVFAYGEKGKDVLIGMSTSGNSQNVVNAVKVARAMGVATISMTGETGGLLDQYSNVCIKIPESETFKVQELTLPIYHALCAMTEATFFEY